MKILRKADVMLITILLIIAGVFNFALYKKLSMTGGVAIININGDQYKKVNLNEDRIYVIDKDGKQNTLEVLNGKIKMLSSNCSDQYCVKHRPIDKVNATIVCLPNKLVVEVEGNEKSQFDSITENRSLIEKRF